MQVQKLEQTLFNFLILGKSRFRPKKSFITSTTATKVLHGQGGCILLVILLNDQCSGLNILDLLGGL